MGIRTRKSAGVQLKLRLAILSICIALSVILAGAPSSAESPVLINPPNAYGGVPSAAEYKEIPRAADSNSLGVWRISYYTQYDEGCNDTTANGENVRPGICAAPPEIPFGTVLIVGGEKYTVTDRGGAIQGKRLDIYVESQEEAFRRGIEYLEVVRHVN
jgi:3D (Asp-Asp-Asp) domain-containing protein